MEKNVTVNNFVMNIENLLSDEACDYIVKKLTDDSYIFNSNSCMSNAVGRQDRQWDGGLSLGFLSGLQLNEENKNGEELIVNNFLNILREVCSVYVKTFAESCTTFEQEGIIDFSAFKFQETTVGGGFHKWHSENNTANKNRFLVWSLFLNDVEEGGELEFLNYPIRVKPKKGSIVLFPPYYTHLHRGNPPLSNTKYIATGWFYHYSNILG